MFLVQIEGFQPDPFSDLKPGCPTADSASSWLQSLFQLAKWGSVENEVKDGMMIA